MTKAKALSLLAATVVACAAAFPAFAGPNLVTNGGFETAGPPPFPGWTQAGDTSFSEELCNLPAGQVSEGQCSGWFGPSAPGGISQTIAVKAGGYSIQFDVAFFDGSVPSDRFSATFDGVLLVSLVDRLAGPFQHFAFIVNEASAHNASLVFQFQNDQSFVILDNVSVQAPEPASFALLGLGLAGLGYSRRKLNK